jgi:hypothetical protein
MRFARPSAQRVKSSSRSVHKYDSTEPIRMTFAAILKRQNVSTIGSGVIWRQKRSHKAVNGPFRHLAKIAVADERITGCFSVEAF